MTGIGTAANGICDTGESTGERATERDGGYVGTQAGRERATGGEEGGGREARDNIFKYLF